MTTAEITDWINERQEGPRPGHGDYAQGAWDDLEALKKATEKEAVAKVPRECWSCKRLEVDPGCEGEQGWSEMTPGEEPVRGVLKCRMDHFDSDMAMADPSSLQRCLTMATDCADYEPRKDG